MTFICDQILSEITNSIIFDIAKEEGLQDEDYKSPVIDNLLREFHFWNNLIPNQVLDKPNGTKHSHNQIVLNNSSQDSDAGIINSVVGDAMGLETNIYQLVQKSMFLSPLDSQSQDSPMQDNFKIQPLSILQTPSTINPPAKIPKARGR